MHERFAVDAHRHFHDRRGQLAHELDDTAPGRRSVPHRCGRNRHRRQCQQSVLRDLGDRRLDAAERVAADRERELVMRLAQLRVRKTAAELRQPLRARRESRARSRSPRSWRLFLSWSRPRLQPSPAGAASATWSQAITVPGTTCGTFQNVASAAEYDPDHVSVRRRRWRSKCRERGQRHERSGRFRWQGNCDCGCGSRRVPGVRER